MLRKKGMVTAYRGIVFSEALSTNRNVAIINSVRTTHTSDAIINPLLIGGKGALVPLPLHIGIGIGIGIGMGV